MDLIENLSKPKIRKVQAIHGVKTLTLCIPRDFISEMQIAKGDYVKCTINGNKLVVEKAEI
ncbi:MAG TPA: hypothetical protein VFP49_10345 [Nitrososphaeraceae archaeon]|nr:hypothetical protein [Nitrososphaeraceae archaeon]